MEGMIFAIIRVLYVLLVISYETPIVIVPQNGKPNRLKVPTTLAVKPKMQKHSQLTFILGFLDVSSVV
jgi:hypothetical protein